MMDLNEACARLRKGGATLTLLNLSHQCIGNIGVRKLYQECCRSDAATMERPASLVMLWLENDLITASGCDDLVRLLRCQPKLKYLYLARNAVSDAGVAALAPWCLRRMLVWNIAENGVTETGARDIARLLRANDTRTTTLVLESNQIGDDGAIALASALQHNTVLERLDIRFNGVTERGLEAFLYVLVRYNKTLKYLHVCESDDPTYVYTTAVNGIRPRRRNNDYTDKRDTNRLYDHLRHEIEYYLELNRAGRRAFSDMTVPTALFARILRKSSSNPSVQFALLSGRPDLLERKE